MLSYFNQAVKPSTPKEYVEVYYKRDDKKDYTIYESVVPFTRSCGLIRITGQSDKVNIIFTDENEFKMICQVDNRLRQHEWESKACYPTSPYWFDAEMKLNTFKEKSNIYDEIRTITCQLGVRGGNRLLVDLRNFISDFFENNSFAQSNTISHNLFIPKDYDVDVDADIKLLHLPTRVCTLQITCNDVSQIGDCGYSEPGRKSWTYYGYGASSDNIPDTKIKTNGYVDLKDSV